MSRSAEMSRSAAMSRSAERMRRRAALLGGSLALAVTIALPASAAATPPLARMDDPSPVPAGNWSMPIQAMVTPVVALVMPSKDLAGLATVEEREKKVDVRLDANVLFPKDSDVIRPGAGTRLREVALVLKARGAGRVGIDGYTDDLGSAAHGLDLSRRRATAIANRLRTFLPAAQFPFAVRGLGESNFVAPNTSEANRSKNRRVEIHFTAR